MMEIIERELEDDIQKYDDQGQLKRPLCLISVREARNLKFKDKQTARLTAVVSYENVCCTTKTAVYYAEVGKWKNQVMNFELASNSNIKCTIYDEDEDQASCIVGEFEIKLSTLKENIIQTREYKCGLPDRRRADQSCDIHITLLYIRDHGLFIKDKLERRQRAFQMSQQQNKIFLDRLTQRLINIQRAQGLDILEELLCNSVRHPRFSMRKGVFNRTSTSGPGYESLDHSIYGPEQQLEIFLNGKDEEEVAFSEDPPAEVERKPHKAAQNNSNSNSKSGLGTKIPLSLRESLSNQRIPLKFSPENLYRQFDIHHDRKTSDMISEIPAAIHPNFSFSDLDYFDENILSTNDLDPDRRSFKRSPKNGSPKHSASKSPQNRNYLSTSSNPKALQFPGNSDEAATIGGKSAPLREEKEKKTSPSPHRAIDRSKSPKQARSRGSSLSPGRYSVRPKGSDEIFLRGLTRIMIAAKDKLPIKHAPRFRRPGGV